MLDTTTAAGGREDRRLREEKIAWLTTVRSDGQPQSVPVWFLWDGESFLIYSQPDRQKLKNIGRKPARRSAPQLQRPRRRGRKGRGDGRDIGRLPTGQRGRRVRGELPG
jgi:PPOX class probable F420-dependent enzyme